MVAAPPRLLVALIIALLSGQVLGGNRHAASVAGALVSAAAGIMVFGHRRHTWAAACLCAAAIGALQVAALLTPRFPSGHVVHTAGSSVELSGTVRDCVQDAAGRTRMMLEIDAIAANGEWQSAHGRILVTVARVTLPWARGDRARTRLRPRRPRNFGNHGEFDYEAFLARRHIYVTAFAMTDTGWHREALPPDQQHLIDRWRTAIRTALARSLDGVAADISAALIIGETGPLPPLLWERYARTGVAHVLSISGLHVALVASAGYGAARWMMSRSQWMLLCTSVPKLSVAAAIIPVALYGTLARGSAPTLRSVTVVGVFCIGLLLNRRRDWLTSLAAAAGIISVVWPGAVFEIAFQLSFMSVLTIMIGMQPVLAWWRRWEEVHLIRLRPETWRWRLLRAITLTMGTTACAAVGTAPLTAYHFNQVSLITLIANLLIIPLLGMVPVGAGLLAALCVPIAPALAMLLFQFGGMFINCADLLVTVLAQVPGAAVRIVSPTVFELALIYGALSAAILLGGHRRVWTLLCCSALLAADAGYWYWERFHSSQLRVTFLSVGQGDCTIVEFPGAAVMVVDGGGLAGSFDVGQRVVAPYLWRRKIARVDTLVLSHAQHDHYGGLAFLAQAFAPRALWWNGVQGEGHTLAQFWQNLARQGVPAQTVARGFASRVDGVDIDVLAPDAADSGSLNDRSLVIRLRYGGAALLLTGDIEAEGERRLIEREAGRLPAAILKSPHHGSRTSSSTALLSEVRPRIAVISAGFANRFRMPHREVLGRYDTFGTAVWRTDIDGAVRVTVAADGTIAVNATRAR